MRDSIKIRPGDHLEIDNTTMSKTDKLMVLVLAQLIDLTIVTATSSEKKRIEILCRAEDLKEELGIK